MALARRLRALLEPLESRRRAQITTGMEALIEALETDRPDR